MKEVSLIYTGHWSTAIEVPDDWELTHENVMALVELNQQDFDFTDGGASWEVYSAGLDQSAELVVN